MSKDVATPSFTARQELLRPLKVALQARLFLRRKDEKQKDLNLRDEAKMVDLAFTRLCRSDCQGFSWVFHGFSSVLKALLRSKAQGGAVDGAPGQLQWDVSEDLHLCPDRMGKDALRQRGSPRCLAAHATGLLLSRPVGLWKL